jgi:hypothetical protein
VSPPKVRAHAPPRPAPPVGPSPEQLREQARAKLDEELRLADEELDAVDAVTPAGLARLGELLETLRPADGERFPAQMSAWLDVLRVKVRRAVRAGEGAVFMPATPADPVEAEPPALEA